MTRLRPRCVASRGGNPSFPIGWLAIVHSPYVYAACCCRSCSALDGRDLKSLVDLGRRAGNRLFRAVNALQHAGAHGFLRFIGSVVKRAEELIHGRQGAPIVALEIFVMKVVKVIVAIDDWLTGNDQLIEAGVTDSGIVDRDMELEQCVQRVEREKPLYTDRREIQRDLDWVHG